ncbi:MAG TPA: efflux RND transporter periplasmic adaptor subunit [Verrucomicrobiota bacterium]|nr:efflux RND transporter periplasmic adaptor subunit [Verrucomicrobiota bacterium]HNT13944.1 efflux RND transporter periplasmic adaptor subunit [Verrucomicrobiota bacterium]
MKLKYLVRLSGCVSGLRGSTMSLLLTLGWLTGCHDQPAGTQTSSPPPKVEIFTVTSRNLALTNTLPGRIDPVRIAQVRARVDGVVLERKFSQGANVKAGELLYQIDPAPFQAAHDSAAASLARAEANLLQAQQLADRYEPLMRINAVSKQDYDNAVSAVAQGKASVMAAKAALQTAQINLGYCRVTAPISGRIGSALVTEGALVSQMGATEMAVIQQMDPIYFDFTESARQVMQLRRQMEAGQLQSLPSGEARVTLLLPDGSVYPHAGKLLFSDISVDASSGMITLRAEFPNPENWLLPGMFVMGQIEQAVAPEAMLVPQRAVTIGADSQASVLLVDSNNIVQVQPVQLGAAVGGQWVIRSGLKAGDHVVVAGLQKARPGMEVQPHPPAGIKTNTVTVARGK